MEDDATETSFHLCTRRTYPANIANGEQKPSLMSSLYHLCIVQQQQNYRVIMQIEYRDLHINIAGGYTLYPSAKPGGDYFQSCSNV